MKKIIPFLLCIIFTTFLVFVYFYYFSVTKLNMTYDKDDYYIPLTHIQYGRPSFLWYKFSRIDKNIWGLGIDKSVKYEDIKCADGNLSLDQGKMLWLLTRLGRGTLEFRWLKFGTTNNGLDQRIGFGDPDEGFFIGYQLSASGEASTSKFKAVVKNFGVEKEKGLPLELIEDSSRFFIVWGEKTIKFIINGRACAEFTSDELPYGIPHVGLEILIANRQGSPIVVDLVKYDSFLGIL